MERTSTWYVRFNEQWRFDCRVPGRFSEVGMVYSLIRVWLCAVICGGQKTLELELQEVMGLSYVGAGNQGLSLWKNSKHCDPSHL